MYDYQLNNKQLLTDCQMFLFYILISSYLEYLRL